VPVLPGLTDAEERAVTDPFGLAAYTQRGDTPHVECKYCLAALPESVAEATGEGEYACTHCIARMGLVRCAQCEVLMGPDEIEGGVCIGCERELKRSAA
jgi:hypothetical protein